MVDARPAATDADPPDADPPDGGDAPGPAGPGEGAEPDGRREAAVAALVAAATRLFAAHGPDAVPLRTVAAEAGVNYGLIHQYVGTKDDLVALVCRSVSERTAAQVAALGHLDDVVGAMFAATRTDYVSMLTWALLGGRDPGGLLGRSPALAAVADRLDPSTDDATVRVAAMTAMALGWQVFGGFVAAGLGHDGDGDRRALDAGLRRTARALLGPEPAGSPPGGTDPAP